MAYPSDLTDEQWALLGPVFNAAGKRGRKHAEDLRSVVDAMLYIAQTGCQWRYLPESFGRWTRVWSQFRRWSGNGTWARALTELHVAARLAEGRAEATPSMLVIDTHLARGASNGGATFHDRGGPFGGAPRAPSGSSPWTSPDSRWPGWWCPPRRTRTMAPSSSSTTWPSRGSRAGWTWCSSAADSRLGRRRSWDDKQPVFRPIRHAWRVEVAHGRLGRCRRLAKSFENTTSSATSWLQVACIATTLRAPQPTRNPPVGAPAGRIAERT
jgi:putative transposase